MTAPDPRLEEIEGRLSRATPGRWANYGDLTHEIYPADAHEDDEPENIAHHVPCLADAEFIAAAPADVAYLLAELRKAQDKLARVEGLAAELAAESLASRNVAREISKEPITNITRQEIRDHAQAATIATNHATRIRAAVAAANGDGE